MRSRENQEEKRHWMFTKFRSNVSKWHVYKMGERKESWKTSKQKQVKVRIMQLRLTLYLPENRAGFHSGNTMPVGWPSLLSWLLWIFREDLAWYSQNRQAPSKLCSWRLCHDYATPHVSVPSSFSLLLLLSLRTPAFATRARWTSIEKNSYHEDWNLRILL